MNALTNATPAQTMSSREIADLVEKRHDNVKRTIETLAESGVIRLPQIEEVPNPGPGPKLVTVYTFSGERGKRDSIIVVAQLCPEFTARLVDRWQELEQAVQTVDPMRALNDPATMRGLLLSYSEKVLELEAANAELSPKAEALDRIATSDGSLCVTDAAKTLQVRPKDLFAFLRSHGWIYSRPGTSDIAYQSKLQAGLLEHKTTLVHRSDGSEKTTTQVRVTPKGLARLAKEFPPAVQAA